MENGSQTGAGSGFLMRSVKQRRRDCEILEARKERWMGHSFFIDPRIPGVLRHKVEAVVRQSGGLPSSDLRPSSYKVIYLHQSENEPKRTIAKNFNSARLLGTTSSSSQLSLCSSDPSQGASILEFARLHGLKTYACEEFLRRYRMVDDTAIASSSSSSAVLRENVNENAAEDNESLARIQRKNCDFIWVGDVHHCERPFWSVFPNGMAWLDTNPDVTFAGDEEEGSSRSSSQGGRSHSIASHGSEASRRSFQSQPSSKMVGLTQSSAHHPPQPTSSVSGAQSDAGKSVSGLSQPTVHTVASSLGSRNVSRISFGSSGALGALPTTLRSSQHPSTLSGAPHTSLPQKREGSSKMKTTKRGRDVAPRFCECCRMRFLDDEHFESETHRAYWKNEANVRGLKELIAEINEEYAQQQPNQPDFVSKIECWRDTFQNLSPSAAGASEGRRSARLRNTQSPNTSKPELEPGPSGAISPTARKLFAAPDVHCQERSQENGGGGGVCAAVLDESQKLGPLTHSSGPKQDRQHPEPPARTQPPKRKGPGYEPSLIEAIGRPSGASPNGRLVEESAKKRKRAGVALPESASQGSFDAASVATVTTEGSGRSLTTTQQQQTPSGCRRKNTSHQASPSPPARISDQTGCRVQPARQCRSSSTYSQHSVKPVSSDLIPTDTPP